MEERKYTTTSITKKTREHFGEKIPNTDFLDNQVNRELCSVLKDGTGTSNPGIVHYKLGLAIANSQRENCNIYVLHNPQYQSRYWLLGINEGGSKNVADHEYFALDLTTGAYYATNMYSHKLFMVLIACIRYFYSKRKIISLEIEEAEDLLKVGREMDMAFRQIDFSTGFIDSNQEPQFLKMESCLWASIKILLKNKSFYNDLAPTEFWEHIATKYERYFETNGADSIQLVDITSYLQNDYQYDKENATQLKDLLNTASFEVSEEKPEEMVVKTPSKRLERLKQKYFNGYQTFTQDEIKSMPLLLQNGYALAQTSFQQNRDFFGLQEWELVDAIACGDVHSINFTGPAGTGKTTTIRSIAGALGMPFVLVGGSANIEETDLLGTRNVEADNGVSVTTWTDGPITSCIRYGGFLLFDEVNAADPGILMKLNTILDGSKSLILSTAEEVRVHPKFVYSEAMNVGAAYAGTDQMNQSHFDRCDEMFKIDAKSPAQEAEILEKTTGYHNLKVLEKMCNIKSYILDLIETEGDASEQICSIRRLIAWVRKSKRTGEFIESSLSTVIAHLCVYDSSLKTLSVNEVQESSGIASTVMEKIIEEFKNEAVNDDDWN